MDWIPRGLLPERPAGACATDPPDAAEGEYADYVERLEERIAGRSQETPADDERPRAAKGETAR